MAKQEAETDFFDPAAFDENLRLQNEGIEVSIRGLDNKPTGFIWSVYGPDSDKARQAGIDLAKLIEAEAAKEGDIDLDSPDAQRRRQMLWLAKMSAGWNKPFGPDRLAFSEENAVTVLMKYPIIADQVRYVADRRGSFIAS